MKAIETEYAGHLFRSRLEARWAVFFDTAGIEWKYEPEGFETTDERGRIRYLPDFLLPRSNTWVEVKGTPESFAKEGERLGPFLDYGSPLPGFTDSYDAKDGSGLLVLFDIPYIPWGLVLHPIIVHRKGLHTTYGYFTGEWEGFHRCNYHEINMLSYFYDGRTESDCFDGFGYEYVNWLLNHHIIVSPRSSQKIMDAYSAARKGEV